MKYSRLLFIIGIVALLSISVMNTSFAASKKSESIHSDKISQYILEDYYKNKISEIKKTYIVNFKKRGGDSRKGNFKISIKKSFKNKYKIKSVKVLYTYNDWYNGDEKKFIKLIKLKIKKL